MGRFLPDNNLNYPVLIELPRGTGSGFFLNWKGEAMYLVTAHHVLFVRNQVDNVFGLIAEKVKLTAYDENDTLSVKKTVLEVDLTKAEIQKSEKADIVLVKLGVLSEMGAGMSNCKYMPYVSVVSKLGKLTVVTEETLKMFADVLVSNEVVVIGYPSSLSNKNPGVLEYDKPLLRRGSVAGKNVSNRTIILDCPVYFGNSGGLAIEAEEIAPGQRKFSVIGVVTKYVPFVEEMYSRQNQYTNHNVENSGYSIVVPADEILDLIGKSGDADNTMKAA
ncbi:hypothetical protein EPO33_02190 [Patescibacteria group bacterium]|nr:MAG: hypothetical protein EPO33_02190 [Patescibacteria group bacterium]